MIKYFLRKAQFTVQIPLEIIDIIYAFIDPLTELKQRFKQPVLYKRLITDDFYYNSFNPAIRNYCFRNEETQLKILLKNRAYNLINNIHKANLDSNMRKRCKFCDIYS
tara:strand:- start:1387 stop:1710 length:324 start_codon:yes stop_codon:yes gene_type:complete